MDKFILLMKGNIAECIGNKILTKNNVSLHYFYR